MTAFEHLGSGALALYMNGGLDRLQMARLVAHCQTCPTCRHQLALRRWARTLQKKPAPPAHSLAYGECFADETLTQYANGELTDTERQQVAEHLPTCAVCRTELDVVRYVKEHAHELVWPPRAEDL